MCVPPPSRPSTAATDCTAQNRRLRHIQGITLRNLAIEDDHDEDQAAARSAFSPALRRRATIEWATASPLSRQQKLQAIAARRMADTFFSLHISRQKPPVYVSEVAEKAMNPDFNWFDLGAWGPAVTRLDTLTIRIWARRDKTAHWQHVIDYTVQLAALHFVGTTLGSVRHPLPQNCVLFHLADGIYTTFNPLPTPEMARHEALAPPREHPDGRILPSSSYDALMRLSTLDDCIQDALATRDRIADDIARLLDANRASRSTVERVSEAEEKLKTVEAAVTAEKRRVVAARRRRDDLAAALQQRKSQMCLGREQQSMLSTELPSQRETHAEIRSLVSQQAEAVTSQRRRICEDIQRIYPIEPISGGKSLAFTIRGLPLPNSDFDDADQDVVAAALSYVAHTVSLLSSYLSVSLPYPITLHGSTSTIHDPLALGTPTAKASANIRVYPLYMCGVVRYRFDYAVFLLNKDIEILSNALGLRPLDIRHTLPNLKYLLYIASAGKGELPARKAGGIKGLLGTGRAGRKGSVDSFGSLGTMDSGDPGTPVEESKRNLDHAGARGEFHANASVHVNGGLVGILGGRGRSSVHAGSRLRPAEDE